MHVAGDDALLRAQEQVLAVDEKIRNDPRDGAARIEHRIGERSHQAD